MSQNSRIKPWYKHVWPWVLMAGPIFVVIASVAMFFVAQQHATDLVTDDYYKDGKNIDIQLYPGAGPHFPRYECGKGVRQRRI